MPELRSLFNSPRPASRRFSCDVRYSGRAAAWIRARGELDLSATPQFEPPVNDALSSALLVIIDLRELTFIDSSGLHVIMEANDRARRCARRLVLIRGPGQIDRLFALLGISDRLEMIDLKPILVSAPPLRACAPLEAVDDLPD